MSAFCWKAVWRKTVWAVGSLLRFADSIRRGSECAALGGRGSLLFCLNMCWDLKGLLFDGTGVVERGVALWPGQLLVRVHSRSPALRKLRASLRDGRKIVPSFALVFGRIGQVLSVAACGLQQLMHLGGHKQLSGSALQAGLFVTAVTCSSEE